MVIFLGLNRLAPPRRRKTRSVKTRVVVNAVCHPPPMELTRFCHAPPMALTKRVPL
jgi:hypothetical protein